MSPVGNLSSLSESTGGAVFKRWNCGPSLDKGQILGKHIFQYTYTRLTLFDMLWGCLVLVHLLDHMKQYYVSEQPSIASTIYMQQNIMSISTHTILLLGRRPSTISFLLGFEDVSLSDSLEVWFSPGVTGAGGGKCCRTPFGLIFGPADCAVQ